MQVNKLSLANNIKVKTCVYEVNINMNKVSKQTAKLILFGLEMFCVNKIC